MISVTQTKTALAANRSASFYAIGGTGPYVYTVAPGGAGGTVNSSTGVYQAPAVLSQDPRKLYDTIIATDSLLDTGSAQIQVTDTLRLVCEILAVVMDLPGRVFLFNQRHPIPADDKAYVVVSILNDKPIANVRAPNTDGAGIVSEQFVTTVTTLSVAIKSRSTEAMTRRFEVLMALNSDYSQMQQSGNSFSIAKLPPGSRFNNFSGLDGAAIPYSFHLDINVTHAVSKNTATQYFDDFSDTEVFTNS